MVASLHDLDLDLLNHAGPNPAPTFGRRRPMNTTCVHMHAIVAPRVNDKREGQSVTFTAGPRSRLGPVAFIPNDLGTLTKWDLGKLTPSDLNSKPNST
jgi:hypothetical protein